MYTPRIKKRSLIARILDYLVECKCHKNSVSSHEQVLADLNHYTLKKAAGKIFHSKRSAWLILRAFRAHDLFESICQPGALKPNVVELRNAAPPQIKSGAEHAHSKA